MKTLLVAAVLTSAAGLAAAQEVAMQEQGAVRFACGGAGAEERAALAALRPQANLELVFVTAKRGGYLADVQLSLHAQDRPAPVLQTVAGGPICMIALPAGRYRIEAAYGGAKRTLQAAAGARLATVAVAFPEEPWDGIRSSAEEKQQARAR